MTMTAVKKTTVKNEANNDNEEDKEDNKETEKWAVDKVNPQKQTWVVTSYF